jgi:hypothetical protein
MRKKWNMDDLGVAVDMAGCPNNCRHCWLGNQNNGNMSICEFREIAAQFKDWKDENGKAITNLGFSTWHREPDYRDDYRELWELEKELSSPGMVKKFELLSIWRLARDEGYAKWAAEVFRTHAENKKPVCQISFFGMEESTDWGVNRKGAFKDSILATNRLIEDGIAPRWQLFATKRGLSDFEQFTGLIYELDLFKRCEAIGHKFEVFVNCFSPEGNGFHIDHETLEEDDLSKIPQGLVDICRDSIENFGKPEYVWLDNLANNNSPPNLSANMYYISINANYDAYPNIAEPAEWWRLGNLKTDGVDKIIKVYRDETTPGMRANREMPVSELARRYGIKGSKKMYAKSDLMCRFMHQWGVDYMEGK